MKRLEFTCWHSFRQYQRLKDGKLCVTAIVKAQDGNHTRIWHIAALGETVQAALLHLSYGDLWPCNAHSRLKFARRTAKLPFRLASLPSMSLVCIHWSRTG